MPNYVQYQQEIKDDIAETLQRFQCQPILFIGSGFSLRYASGPNWEALLTQLAQACPTIEKEFAYFKQKYDSDLTKVGSHFANEYFEWAWSKEGKKQFPAELFGTDIPRDTYIKYKAAELLKHLTTEGAHKALQGELEALKELGPHAVITTNYDALLEPLFPQYEVIVGQRVFRQSALVVGEIFKIHGSVAEPESMILTREDYDAFDQDKKYLSAKLLTYFAEHPLLFIGYSATDQNIKNILYDMSRMFTPTSTLIRNIYILQWDNTITEHSMPAKEQVLEVGDGINVRIKSISANDFRWVYEAFSVGGTMEKVDLKALRALANRMHNLIRTDIPTKNVQVNYEALEHAISNEETFGKLFGVTNLGDPAAANANHPYLASQLAEQVGVAHWYHVNQLIDQVKAATGFDMKAFDNIYHVHIKTGQAANSRTRKYSDAAVALLKKVLNGANYEIPKNVVDAQHQPPAKAKVKTEPAKK
ncbi:SIR2 family protein [Rhodoferax sp. TBRC 17198]|uniref:SIR2 family protein n=1 Tax=Rhodoferax potami TaxID=3068338 RepID=UPI0028BD3DC1|nr:SIR2 family protein [Rhodoferax sp. TBRC 17198]MDT7521069.1 SIR2 family protein [Rhodoferax sp. TBRC 17198]